MPARPYRLEFPNATEDGIYVRNRSWPTLERAIDEARCALNWVKKSDLSPANDASVAVITNRETGYRWIMRRGSAAVEFQTPEMLTDRIAAERVNVYLSVEEAVVLLEVAEAAQLGDKRQAALMKQATEQLAILIAQVVEAHRHATANVRSYARLRGEP